MISRMQPLLRRLNIVVIAIAIFLILMPTSSPHAFASLPCTATCTVNGLAVRTGPGTSYTKIGSLQTGTVVTALEESGGWYRFDFNGKTGWSSGKYLTLSAASDDSADPPEDDASIGTAVCSASSLKVRSGPGTSYGCIGTLKKNQTAILYDSQNNWYQIGYNSSKGWVSGNYLTNIQLSAEVAGEPEADEPAASDTPAGDTIIGCAVISTGGSSLNVRKGPGTGYSRLCTVAKGSRHDVYAQQNGWLRILIGDQQGWICESYTVFTAAAAPVADEPVQGGDTTQEGTIEDAAPIGVGYVKLSSGSLSVRKGPGTSYSKIGSLSNGTAVDIMAISGNWYYISYDGAFGYVSKNYIRVEEIDDSSYSPTTPISVDDATLIASIKGTVKLINWFGTGGVKDIWERGSYATVIDVRTGAVMRMKYWRGDNHADVETATKEDTAKLKQCYGGRWSWSRRPVWVIINGQAYAASINGMPHSNESITNNGMDGQICMHFVGSKTHNTNKVCPLHQAAIQEAYLAGQ